jgi:hypothetical protein
LKKKEKQQAMSTSTNPDNEADPSSSSPNHEAELKDEDSDDDLEPSFTSTPNQPLADLAKDMGSLSIEQAIVDNAPAEAAVRSPLKESIVAPIMSMSQPPAASSVTSSRTYTVDSSITSTFISPSNDGFMTHKTSSAPSNDVPISPTDSLLNILLGRTPTTSAESAIFNALNGNKAGAESAPTVIATANVSNSIPNTINNANSAATSTNANQAASSLSMSAARPSQAAPATAQGNPQKLAPPPGVIPQSSPAMQYYQQGMDMSSNAFNGGFNSSMPIHIQHQAQQPFFNPLAASYAPSQAAPPGLSNAYPSMAHAGLSNVDGFPQYSFGDFGPSSNDFSFPMGAGMKAAQQQQVDYSYGSRLNMGGSKVMAPPGFAMQQQQQQQAHQQQQQLQSSQAMYMQAQQQQMQGNSNSHLGHYPAGMAASSMGAARPSYAMQMQGYQQGAASPYMGGGGGAGPAQMQQHQYMQQQQLQAAGQQQQMLSRNSNSNGEHISAAADDRSNGGYYPRSQASKMGNYQMHL